MTMKLMINCAADLSHTFVKLVLVRTVSQIPTLVQSRDLSLSMGSAKREVQAFLLSAYSQLILGDTKALLDKEDI